VVGRIFLDFRHASHDLQLKAVKVSPVLDCDLHHKYLHAKVGRLIAIVVPAEAWAQDMDRLWDQRMAPVCYQAYRAHVETALAPSMVGEFVEE